MVAGWLFHVKLLSRSGVFLLFSIVGPVVYASVAFFMFRAGDRPDELLYAAIGAGTLGLWYTTLVGSGQAITRLRQEGMLELLVAAPAPFFCVLAPATLAAATVGPYGLAATVLWGWLLFDVPLQATQPLLLAVAIPVLVLGLGVLGVVLAAVFVLYRHANAYLGGTGGTGVVPRWRAAAGDRRLRRAHRWLPRARAARGAAVRAAGAQTRESGLA